jgi:hypothetical protein
MREWRDARVQRKHTLREARRVRDMVLILFTATMQRSNDPDCG